MRSAVVMIGLVLLSFAGGCAGKFGGEWLEEGAFARDGSFIPAEGPRRSALKFMPPSTVRYGKFVSDAGVVDQEGCQQDTYLTMDHGNVAQFGATIARVDGNRLTTYIGAEPARVYVRVKKGTNIFPPMAVLPTLAKADQAKQPVQAPSPADSIAPVMASTSKEQVNAPPSDQ